VNNNLIFERTGAAGSIGPVYSYSDLNNSRIKGQIECVETDLVSDLARLMSLTRQYLTMAFIVAGEHPEDFDAASVEQIAKELLNNQEKRIEDILSILEKNTGQIQIVETLRGNGHVEENRIVDVYFDKSRMDR